MANISNFKVEFFGDKENIDKAYECLMKQTKKGFRFNIF